MNAAEQLIEQGREQGLQQGRLEGLRLAVAAVLDARDLPLSELGRVRLASCADVERLRRWHARAITASCEADVFGDD